MARPTHTAPESGPTPRDFYRHVGGSVDSAWRAWNEEAVVAGRTTLSRDAFRKAVRGS